MPRNGSGVYSPTAGVPVVSGTTISSTAINNVLDDLGDEITASLPVSGVAPMTGVLRVTAGTVGAPGLVPVGDTNTGIYSPGADQLAIATGGVNALTFSATQTTAWAAKATGKAFDVDSITDVTSASTCDIGAAATSEVNITGTTTITGFGTSNAGIVRRCTFADVLTLTHNGTSLILPGAANITTAAGDSFVARSLGGGNWRVLSYQFSARTALVNATQQASTSGTAIDFNTIPPWAKQVTIMLNGVSLSGTDNLLIQIGDSGGIENTGYSALTSVTANAAGTLTVSSTAGFPVFAGGAARLVYGTIILSLMDAATFTWTATGTGHESGGLNFSSVNGVKALSAALDRVRITTTGSNTFDAGTINVMFE